MRHAGVCFLNVGSSEIILNGETKRCTSRDTGIGLSAPCVHPADKPPGQKYRWLVGVRFLRSGSTDWLSQAHVILDRFGFGQAGWFGEWAAWLAAVLAVLSAALALWWLGREPRPNPFGQPMRNAGEAMRSVRAVLGRAPRGAYLCALLALLNALTWSLIVPAVPSPRRAGSRRLRPVRRRDRSAPQPRHPGTGRLRGGASSAHRDRLEAGGSPSLEPPAGDPRCAPPPGARRGRPRSPNPAGSWRRHRDQLLAPLLRGRRRRVPALARNRPVRQGARDARRLGPAHGGHRLPGVPVPAGAAVRRPRGHGRSARSRSRSSLCSASSAVG